jgi:hypothetical protein
LNCARLVPGQQPDFAAMCLIEALTGLPEVSVYATRNLI